MSKPRAPPNHSWDAHSQAVSVGDKIIETTQNRIQIAFSIFCTTFWQRMSPVAKLPMNLDQAAGEFTQRMNFNLKNNNQDLGTYGCGSQFEIMTPCASV